LRGRCRRCWESTTAAVGLSVLPATSPFAFPVVKLCGAAYLIYLGARLLTWSSCVRRGAGEPREKVLLMIVQ